MIDSSKRLDDDVLAGNVSGGACDGIYKCPKCNSTKAPTAHYDSRLKPVYVCSNCHYEGSPSEFEK